MFYDVFYLLDGVIDHAIVIAADRCDAASQVEGVKISIKLAA